MKRKKHILESKTLFRVCLCFELVSDLYFVYRLVKEKVDPIKGLYKLTKWVEDHGLKRAAVTNAPRPNPDPY